MSPPAATVAVATAAVAVAAVAVVAVAVVVMPEVVAGMGGGRGDEAGRRQPVRAVCGQGGGAAKVGVAGAVGEDPVVEAPTKYWPVGRCGVRL